MKTQEEKKRVMLLVLPILILPMLALMFYALGGGRNSAQAKSINTVTGINTELPSAKVKQNQSDDKMTAYNKAQRDSTSTQAKSASNAFAALGRNTTKRRELPVSAAEENETKINQRISEIHRRISENNTAYKPMGLASTTNSQSTELERMERLIRQKQQTATPDPQMRQLNEMLDKIMQIQNPALVREMATTEKRETTDSAFKAIPAVIDGNQKVAQGGIVKLRLQDTLKINGIRVPKGQPLFGSCTITNQRLLLDIRNIRLGTAIVPVNLTVFSLDGIAGIKAPKAELAEAAGNGANGALGNMQFLSMDNSLSTQAATAGIAAAKGLLGKKVRKIRVKLKGNYPVLLRNNEYR